MNEKGFDPELLISHRLELSELPGIFKQIDDGKLLYNKIMFYPNGMDDRR